MTSDEYAQILDDFELNAPGDVMPGESLTEYIERRRREFESKADGGSIGIEVLFKEKMANGGRVPMLSGGALKTATSGIMKLFGKGDDAVDLAKQEEIFRSGDITTDFLEKVDDKVIKKFITTRDTKGPGGYGMYDSFDDMPNGLKAAELISRIKTADGGINYEAAELFIGKKLKGDETVDELIKMVIKKPGLTDSPLKDFENYVLKGDGAKDGGRVGLFMGGDPLTGQALQIYNSMKGYNFSDQEIADALSARGLYTAAGSGTGTETTAPNIIGSQISQGKDTAPTRPTSEIVADFQETITNRQNKLTNPGKIASFVGDFIPQQRSVADMLASGQVDTRMTGGIPLGVGSMIAKALPDKYYDMSLADQITTQAYMGFTDPKTNMGNKDPFGLNVRSAFGNYAEKAAEIVDTLEAKLAKNGMLSNYDQSRLNHYKNVTATKQAAVTDLGLINLAKEQEAKRQADLQAKIQAEIAAGKSLSQIGRENFTGKGQAFERRSDTFSGGKVKNTGGVPGGKYGSPRKDGGLMFARGGLATMFTRRR